jgi:hypothetical protein
VEITLMPVDSYAYNHGKHYDFNFSKDFGDCMGYGGPTKKDRAEILRLFRNIVNDWRGYEHILERDLKSVEEPNPKNTQITIDKKIKWITVNDFWNAMKYKQTTLF